MAVNYRKLLEWQEVAENGWNKLQIAIIAANDCKSLEISRIDGNCFKLLELL